MFKRVLVANRGEIAQRIIRCCIEMGIECIAAYSKADENEIYVPFATDSICIGAAPAKDSYLNIDNVISAAIATKCDAVHPGYGFLSENAEFAKKCEQNGIKFIGPPSDVIEKMGVKQTARELMMANDVPVVPGSSSTVETAEEAASIANEIGYPVLIKASAGGGGRGMRRADTPQEIEDAFNQARSEAISCFGNGDVYVEKLILNPKHVEIQIFADTRGNCVYLGERDCSIQRKNQKMVEETPCARLTPKVRDEMGKTAVKAARAAGYINAGTVEFVVDEDLNYYFIEMNTRIQVEHPITEMVYSVDLVREQIRVAAGLPLGRSQEELKPRGHAIECRINAESPVAGFSPCPGKITLAYLPSGIGTRVDSAIYDGYEVSPYYDSLIAKIIVWAPTRLEAVRKMRRCLEETVIEGIDTNLDFELFIMFHSMFLRGNYNTGFIEQCIEEILDLEKRAVEIETAAEADEGVGTGGGVAGVGDGVGASVGSASKSTGNGARARLPQANTYLLESKKE